MYEKIIKVMKKCHKCNQYPKYDLRYSSLVPSIVSKLLIKI